MEDGDSMGSGLLGAAASSNNNNGGSSMGGSMGRGSSLASSLSGYVERDSASMVPQTLE